jgi:protocatechuate 3,4-dioxygenase beta subunit
MKKLLLLLFCAPAMAWGQRAVGGPCEGCEAIHESPVPFDRLQAFTRLPGVTDSSPNRLGINGVVFQADRKTPAPDVILYIYHTDPETGIYPRKGDEKGWARRHGYIRGWMKTNHKGEYKFVTRRPAPYPDRTEPAHIHIVVLEPGLKEYYIDEYLFDDDPLLTDAVRKRQPNRGGSGILHLKDVGEGMFKAERNIYLGRNIPGYPSSR